MSWFGKNAVWFCHVLLLDESEHPVEIRKKTNGEEVLEKVFQHLNLLERDYFGLRYIDRDSQSRWLDPLKPVVKQLKAGPPYLLYFCVKFYAADPCRLHEELTRYLFFLQVKKDIYQGRLPCATNVLAELSSYSIQCESLLYCSVLNLSSLFSSVPPPSQLSPSSSSFCLLSPMSRNALN
ncbi:PREDICTED: band 4.1-like protein 4A [Acropora digitifera]|uniref:band 4.1-like protein 4A n=1 Tax=Acropora digitifera TaxID=70779 RepID=UPI000779F1B3|nr:PREDICTED: band 4.1-like protein 4A [Acropora digitifera]